MKSTSRIPSSLLVALGCSFACLAASCGGPPAAVSPASASSSAPSASTSAAPVAVEAKAPTVAACVPQAKAQRPLARVEVAGSELIVCVGSTSEPTADCVSVDPLAPSGSGIHASPAWTRAANAGGAVPPAASPGRRHPPFDVKASANDVAICKLGSDDCKLIKPGYTALPGVGWGEDYKAAAIAKSASPAFTRKLVAAANADGSKLFVLDVEAAKKGSTSGWNIFGDTFDAAGKRLSHVQLSGGAGSSNAIVDPGAKWQAAWLGDRLWLAGTDPRTGDSSQEFFDPNAGTTLDLGNPSFLLDMGEAWLVGTSQGGYGLVKIVEPKSLANLGKYPLPNQPTPNGDGLSSFAVARGDGTAWVAFANPPGVMIVDVSKHAASTPVMIPICK